MIVISSSLVLAAAEQTYPLTYPVFGYHNLVDVADITTDTEDADFPASNLANPSTNLKWRGGGGSPALPERVVFDVSDYIDGPDYIGLAGHNFGTAQIGVTPQYWDETVSPAAWVDLASEIMPADDGPLIFRFTQTPTSQISLLLAVGTAAPELAVPYVGKLLVMQRGVQDFTPLRFGRNRDVVTGMSEAGDFIGRIQVGGRSESEPTFIGLERTWFRANVDDFLEASATTPFFFSWNPQDYPEDTGFSWLRRDPQPLFDRAGYVSLTLEMTGILR